MIRAYLDSSAIVKLSRLEPESLTLVDYLEDTEVEVSTSVLAEVEVIRALRRLQLDEDGALRGFYLLGFDDDVRRAAATIRAPFLRSLDVIHIASALTIGAHDLDFITYDDRMAAAARECGLTVVQPGR